MPRTFRLEMTGVALLALLALFSTVRRDLFVGDETKYGQVVREMHADGAVLVPTLNGEPYTHKPPLHFWLMYLTTGVGGQRTIWPYVLPAMLAGLVLAFLTGRIASRWLGAGLAWPSRFFLTGLAMAWGLAQTARMDLLFGCLTTAGAVAVFRYIDEGGMQSGLAAGFWFGLAGLVKGPMAILILASLFVVESVASRRRPKVADLALVVVSVAVPLAWFVPAVLSAGGGYLEEIVMRQTAGRVVDSWVHRQPPWYYLAGSPAIVFPWFFVLLAGIRTAAVAGSDNRAPLMRCMRWVVAIVLPFSLISSKLPVYMVPAFPPVAMIAAWYAGLTMERMRWRAFAMWGNRMLFVMFAVVPVLILSGVVPVEGDDGALLQASGIRIALFSMVSISLAGLVAGWRSIRAGSLALPFVVAVPLTIALTTAAPAINDYASSRLLVREIERNHRPGDEIGMHYTPHLWSRDLPVELESARQLRLIDLEAGARPDILVVRHDKIEKLGRVLESYQEVAAVRLMGKTFDVYRLR